MPCPLAPGFPLLPSPWGEGQGEGVIDCGSLWQPVFGIV